ncbi:MAG: DUF4358 domain-containing protein [Bacillota bacterium]|nr:DUF4358 domain-containing protein [Bacillota bacterium]
MKKYLFIKIFLLLGLGVFFANSFITPMDSDQSIRTVLRNTTKKTSVRNLAQKDNVDIKRILSIDPEDYEEIRYYKSSDIMNADEFLMVKFKSHDDWDKFRDSISKHVKKIEDIYEDYKPKEGKKIKEYTLCIKGNFGFYYVGEDASVVIAQFKDALGG